MAKMTVDQLSKNLQDYSYTPRTEEERKTAAENRYKSIYDQKKLSANQSYQTQDLAYENQLADLQNTLSQNQEDLAKQTENSRLQAQRYMITRGMQRSSYGAANDTNIMNSGLASQQKLLNQYQIDANEIGTNRTLLAQQLADTLSQYDTDYQNDVLAYMDELEQTDYEREQAAKEAQNALEMQMFEYYQKYGKSSSSGGSSRRSSSGSGSTATTEDTNTTYNLWDALGNSLAAIESNITKDNSAYWSRSASNAKASTQKSQTYTVDTSKKNTSSLASIKANAASTVAAKKSALTTVTAKEKASTKK